jgi:hypothetical protein
LSAHRIFSMSTATKETEYKPVVIQGNDYADVYDGDGTSPMIRGPKQGHKCCGSCCDVRRAVIAVNVLNVLVLLLGIIVMIAFQMAASTMDYDDDNTQTTMDAFANLALGLLIAICLVPTVFSAVGIAGALLYNKWMAGSAGAFYCLSMIYNVFQLNIFGLVLMGLFAYPHYFLVKEINQGIMTEQNYPNERFSCCCD